MLDICLIFDLGKTNKKVLGFDSDYNVVFENQVIFDEISDDDGEPADDLMAISAWVKSIYDEISKNPANHIKAVNFSAYGASFVYLNKDLQPLAPVYNYLKKLPKITKNEFIEKYNTDGLFFKNVASPDLDLLNSGLQLFWLKKHKIEIFKNTRFALHLPQYFSFLFSGEPKAELTSIGCHTAMWDFEKNDYHQWLDNENWHVACLPPVSASNFIKKEDLIIGPGIHDSSAALVPYLKSVNEPFVLISTGTWCISLNPFNDSLLTEKELRQDCLNFISYEGKTVRASRLFSGNEHSRQVKHLAEYFSASPDFYKSVNFDYKIVQALRKKFHQALPNQIEVGSLFDSPFVERNLNSFSNIEEAYHQFIMDMVAQQVASTQLVFGSKPPRKLFVDGGFSRNPIFMNLLAEAFYNIQVFASELSQASSLGAALVIADGWNEKHFDIAKLKMKRFI